MGDSDPRARYTGNHPLIKREINGQEYVYSVPVIAGILCWKDKGTGKPQYSAISVMKDNWQNGADAWNAIELNLQDGTAKQIDVLGVVVDKANNANIVLKPTNYEKPLRPVDQRLVKPLCTLWRESMPSSIQNTMQQKPRTTTGQSRLYKLLTLSYSWRQ